MFSRHSDKTRYRITADKPDGVCTRVTIKVNKNEVKELWISELNISFKHTDKRVFVINYEKDRIK